MAEVSSVKVRGIKPVAPLIWPITAPRATEAAPLPVRISLFCGGYLSHCKNMIGGLLAQIR